MVVLVCRNLLFVSKAGAAARQAAVALKLVGDCAAAAALGPAVKVALVDLAAKPAPGAIAALRSACPAARIVCFGSHVDAEALRNARAEGADAALPNSQLDAGLDALMALAAA